MAFQQNAGGNIFGGQSGTSGSAFGGGGGTTPNTTSGGLFGASKLAPSTGGGIFGGTSNVSTTTAPHAGGSIFGGGSNNVAPTPSSGASGGLFSGANTSNTQTSTNGPGLFGGPKASGTGLFGGAGSTTAAPTTGNIFGTSTTSPPAASTNSLFTGTSAFSLPKSGDTTANPTKPAASSFFTQPNTANNNNASTAAPSVGSGLFSLPSKPASSATPASSGTLGNIFGGGSFGQPSTTLPASGTAVPSSSNKETPTPSTNLAAGTGLFGSVSGNKDAEKKESASPAASAFNLFGATKSTEKEGTPTSKDGEKKENLTAAAPTTTNPTAAIAIPPPSMLRGKSLEEIVNRWTADLENNVREFNKFAAEVSVWDRALIENGNNIAALHSHVQAAERQQNDINESLEHIEHQQKDLAFTLDTYEKISQEILGGYSGNLRTLDAGPADTERDKNYMIATDLHTHLDDLSGSLTQMIDSVNALSLASKPADALDDPMSQIAQILSSHLESLQWIDTAVREVESKTTDVEKRIKESGHNLSGSKSRPFGPNH